MPRRKGAHRLPPHCPDPSLEEIDNRARNEVQKTVLLLEHRLILRKRRATLLEGYQEVIDKGKKSVADLKETVAKKSDYKAS